LPPLHDIQRRRGLARDAQADLRDNIVRIHLGLNDCASRIFMERERLALGAALQARARRHGGVLVRRYRVQIVHDDPEYNYVPLEQYRFKLSSASRSPAPSAPGRFFLSTIVQPPLKSSSARHTCVGIRSLHLAAADVAKRLSAKVVDVDRLCWGGGTATTLNADGMHLAARHRRLRTIFWEQAKPYLPSAARPELSACAGRLACPGPLAVLRPASVSRDGVRLPPRAGRAVRSGPR
jgi:hypothetical protein